MVKPADDNNTALSFVIIGAGNVGTQLTRMLFSVGIQPVQIINRSISKARHLAQETNCRDFSSDYDINHKADFILVTVNDDSLPEVLDKINPGKIPVFHCSGSTPLSIFPVEFFHYGVLYPLQTFTLNRDPDFKNIPFLLEASDGKTISLLKRISSSISNEVLEMNSPDRLKYHIAAVFACNFTNHFLTLASDYLQKNDLPDSILHPLIKETFMKFIERGELNVQTGPAVREDRKTLQKHEEVLKNDPEFQKIYTFVSDNIIKYNKSQESN